MGEKMRIKCGQEEEKSIKDCIRLMIEYQGPIYSFHLIRELPKDAESRGIFDHLRTEYIAMVQYLTKNDAFIFSYFNLHDNCNENWEYYSRCSTELEKIKNSQFEDGTCLENLLVKSIDEIIPLTRNERLVNIIRSEVFIKEFPCYYKTFQFKVNKALEKRLLIDQAINVLRECLPLVDSCPSVLEKIVYYLNDPCLLTIG